MNMANDDEYEILPHQLLADLKSDVEALKKKLTQPDNKADELILEIESLKDSIHELTSIFQKALEATKEEDVSKSMKLFNDRINNIVSQNETIARGMIAISDKLEDFMTRQPGQPTVTIQAQPQMSVRHNMGTPSMPGTPGRFAPMPPMPPMGMESAMNPSEGTGDIGMDFPPPPPGMAEKKKRIGLFK